MRRFSSLVAAAMLAATSLGAPVQAQSAPSNDPYVGHQWAFEEIKAFEAWKHSTGKGALVAVVDSGIDFSHPDLRGNLISRGKDFIDGGEPQDEFGHGTHIAGIIAAVTDNRIGVAGLAPSARLMSVRVLDENNGGDSETLPKAILWAAKHGADVINVSIGYPVPIYGRYYQAGIDDLQEAVDAASELGAVVVMAAGNNYQPACDQGLEFALCVGATGAFEEKAHYSNFDATTLDNYLVAPGGETLVFDCDWQIFSTWLSDEERIPNDQCNPAGPGYTGASGTSMAAPMVSGVAALLASQGLTNTEIIDRILATADDLGAPGKDPLYGAGRVNALRAVTGT